LTIKHVFSCNFRGLVRTDRAFSGVRGLNFTKLGMYMHRSIALLFQNTDILVAFSNAWGSKLSDFSNDAKFRTFCPCENYGRVGEMSIQLLKLYLWSNLRNTFDGHPLRGCWARWVDKKEKKRKFMGKTLIKAFPTNVGQPKCVFHNGSHMSSEYFHKCCWILRDKTMY